MKLKALVLGFIGYLSLTLVYANNLPLEQLRNGFRLWQNTYQPLPDSEQKKMLASLQGYSLYPYAEYQYLQFNIDSLTPEQVNQFVAKNKGFVLTGTLMQNYLQVLAARQDWQNITQLNIDNSTTSKCLYQYALFKQGQIKAALAPIKDIWLSANDLPSACDPIFNQWSQTSEKTTNMILMRINLILKNNNIKLARYLTEQLPDNYKTLKKNLMTLYNDPKTLPNFVQNISPSPFSQRITMWSFSRFASLDTDKARALIPVFVNKQKLSKDDEKLMFRIVANNYFQDSTTNSQIKWRDEFISQDRSTSLVEKRIRQALRTNDLKDVANWLNHLNSEDKLKDEWQYWLAVTLINDKQQRQADKILNTLMAKRGFYAMYSAQILNKPYHFNFDYHVIEKQTSKEQERLLLSNKYQTDPVIIRIDELHYWNMLAEAAKEWRNYLYNTTNRQYAELARYAYIKGWGEHSIQATIAGKLWDNWVERFPILYQDLFNESLKDKSIPLSYVLAIARQESALDTTVKSPAGARGLMQLMPNTAKDSAKKVANLNYTSADQLYNPNVNIQLGTYYLNYVYELYDNNRILSSAAYNAGPNRVKQWLKTTSGKLDAIAFIESIPFTETRNYVKSVLVYDYIYSLLLNHQYDKIVHNNEIDYKY